jgi:hypothetical protein
MQSAADAAAVVVEGLIKARRLSSQRDNLSPTKVVPSFAADVAGAADSAATSPAAASEILADELSLCLTLLSKTISHVFAIIEQLPDSDADAGVDADAAAAAADSHLVIAAQATSALQETMLRLADMCVNSLSLSQPRHTLPMYTTIEEKVMASAISRCWSASEAAGAVVSAAACLAAVEESAFIIGNGCIRALQTRCVMVAAVSMHRSP